MFRLVLAAFALLVFAAAVYHAGAATGTTTRASVTSAGVQGDDDSLFPDISADGRYVVFESAASNLVPGDSVSFCPTPNGLCSEIFIHDRTTGVTESVSGNTPEQSSTAPSVSGDGRYVAFLSRASLAVEDTNDGQDVYLRDRASGTLELVSVGMGGAAANSWSFSVDVSEDGRYVAFSSEASNLVSGDTNNLQDVFLRDRQTGATERLSTDSIGTEANGYSQNPVISADNELVVFYSFASNLVAGDTNGEGDAFVRNLTTGHTERVSLATGGAQANADPPVDISADGRFVAFNSTAPSLLGGSGYPQIFVRDLQAGVTELVSMGADQSVALISGGSLSADGRYVAFWTDSPYIVAGDTNFAGDVFVRDRQDGNVERVSVNDAGEQSKGDYGFADISGDGRYVVLSSSAPDLVACDTNNAHDVFLRDRFASAASSPVRCATESPAPAHSPVPTTTPGALPEAGGSTSGHDARMLAIVASLSVVVAGGMALVFPRVRR